MRIPNEIKAGLVIITAIAVGVFFFYKTAKFKSYTYELRTSFRYAGDLKPDALVKLAGIEVGRVKDIVFVYGSDTVVECVLEIETRAKIRKDSIAYIGTVGFIGDTYIGITGGGAAEFIKPGGTVSSEDPIEMRIFMKKAESIADGLDNALEDMKRIFGNNKESVDNIIGNLEVTTGNFKEFSEDIKRHPWKLMFKEE
ncbi:MAG: MlaD family protein [Candidatus Omnitrophota bacterium]